MKIYVYFVYASVVYGKTYKTDHNNYKKNCIQLN